MVALFSALFATGQFNRFSGGVIAPELMHDLGLSAVAVSVVIAVLFLASALAQVPIGIALDRWGPRRTVVVAVIAAIDAHIEALRAVLAQRVRGDGGATGQQLALGREAMVERMLAETPAPA